MNTKNLKILLIGDLNSTTRDIENALRDHFHVQLCDPDEDNIRKMTNYLRPSLTVFSLVGVSQDIENIFSFLDTSGTTKSVLVVTNVEDFKPYERYMSMEKFEILYRPVRRWDILNHCCKIFGIDINVLEKRRPTEFRLQKINDMSPKTILVVDDSKVMLRNIKQWLDKKYKVELADSAEKAMQRILKNPPDLILLDYNMPGCNGKEFFDKLSQTEYGDIPVIFLTAVDNRSRVLDVLKLMPVRYLLKPVEHDQLMESIEDIFYDDEIS